jgi:hypothetical protein
LHVDERALVSDDAEILVDDREPRIVAGLDEDRIPVRRLIHGVLDRRDVSRTDNQEVANRMRGSGCRVLAGNHEEAHDQRDR